MEKLSSKNHRDFHSHFLSGEGGKDDMISRKKNKYKKPSKLVER